MTVATWLRTLSTRAPRKPARAGRRPAVRPRLHVLEDRSVPSFGWAAAAGGDFNAAGQSNPNPLGNVVATDAAGDVYTAGSFSGAFTPAGSIIPLTSAGGTDVFVTKYSRFGSFLWAERMGGAANDTGRGIAVGSGGGVFVAGSFSQTATFGPTNLTAPTNNPDAFLVKLEAGTGGVSWARNGLAYSGPSHGASGAGVAVDTLGNAYVAVNTSDSWLTVSRVAPDGSLNWQHQYFAAEAQGGGIAVSGGSVYVTGNLVSVDFNPGGPGGRFSVRNGSIANGFVLRLTSGGSFGWARQFAGSSGGNCIPDSIAVDAAGNVYSSGSFAGAVDFDPGKGTFSLNGGSGAGFVTKLNSSGNFVWARQFGAKLGGYSDGFAPFGLGGAMAVDAAGAVYLTTGFTGTVDFNPASGVSNVFNLTSAGGYDTAVVKLNTAGTFQWAVRAGGSADDYGTGIAVNSSGEIYVTGRIGGGTVDFDLTQTYVDDRDLLTGPGGFLWQITQP